jgi:hypothetical protein
MDMIESYNHISGAFIRPCRGAESNMEMNLITVYRYSSEAAVGCALPQLAA